MSHCGGEEGLTTNRQLLEAELRRWAEVQDILIPAADHLGGRVIGIVRRGVPSTGWHHGSTVEDALAAGIRFMRELDRLHGQDEEES